MKNKTGPIKVRIGCDLVRISRFKSMNNSTLDKLFHPREWKNKKPESLAGIFAVKESCKKIFPDLGWHDIEVKNKKDGKPILSILSIHTTEKIIDADCTISHDGEYAISVVVIVLL